MLKKLQEFSRNGFVVEKFILRKLQDSVSTYSHLDKLRSLDVNLDFAKLNIKIYLEFFKTFLTFAE